MVYRLYVERKPAFAQEAEGLLAELTAVLGLSSVREARVINRYDVEGIDDALFSRCVRNVFSEPQTDDVFTALPEGGRILAVEYLPGQYDQRADAAAQCIQLISRGERPSVRTAKLYVFNADISQSDMEKAKRRLINPVECREAALDMPATLTIAYPVPDAPRVLDGFRQMDAAGRGALIAQYGLAMDEADVALCQEYFSSEKRDPTVTELRVLDTYWSDHCRHTTFNTRLTDIEFDDPAAGEAYGRYMALRSELGVKKPVCLMDMATIASRYMKRKGTLTNLDESPEINACTVRVNIEVNGEKQPWLLLFKNETHNHPTEIEPFGGAATCLGGAIRDPLSGRAYVYQAMRVTGAADPRAEQTLPGKLSQRRICTGAAAGYSAYGNQIGLATGLVDEVYHPGYAAKRMEVGAVIGAAPADNVKREEPTPGDVVLLLGGKTGRDGCGGATGSSKAHTVSSLESCGAQVQKGNPPEERKLQRLFRDPEASRMIKRCNDFGAGGVSVAIGELADGLMIDLDAVPKKYAGLDGTELAISESQERMAVVVSAADEGRFIALAEGENLSAVRVAKVTESPRLVMLLGGKPIADIARAFIDTNGATRTAVARVEKPAAKSVAPLNSADFYGALTSTLSSLTGCSRRGLVERFDSTVGALSVFMPLGGKRQLTPTQAMAAKLPVTSGETGDCSVMSYAFDPELSSASPYRGAYMAVAQSVAKLAATAAPLDGCCLSLQEYFPKPGSDPRRWGLPTAAVLGALSAQLDLGVAAIGGKDSMSGTYEDLDVPPTLISFAVTMAKAGKLLTPEFKRAGSCVVLLRPEYDENGLPVAASLKANMAKLRELALDGAALSAYAVGSTGAAEAIFKMCVGNGFGFKFDNGLDINDIFSDASCAFVIELAPGVKIDTECLPLGVTLDAPVMQGFGGMIPMRALEKAYSATLEGVYPTKAARQSEYSADIPRRLDWTRKTAAVKPANAKIQTLIPVFPGTNCEYESARAIERAGATAKVFVINTLDAAHIKESAAEFARELGRSSILFIPGGFSGGDEPDGSGKFITAFLRSPDIADAIAAHLEVRDGLILGVCNGFQALIKLGLVPFGQIREPDACAPTLTFNAIGRHQSRLVRTRIVSNRSPWLLKADPKTVYTVPISHGEGRFVCGEEQLRALAANGQIATQYVDLSGAPSMDINFNPALSSWAVEGITSPDGRVLGKMGHSERVGNDLYRNVPGEFDMKLFESAVEYFK